MGWEGIFQLEGGGGKLWVRQNSINFGMGGILSLVDIFFVIYEIKQKTFPFFPKNATAEHYFLILYTIFFFLSNINSTVGFRENVEMI